MFCFSERTRSSVGQRRSWNSDSGCPWMLKHFKFLFHTVSTWTAAEGFWKTVHYITSRVWIILLKRLLYFSHHLGWIRCHKIWMMELVLKVFCCVFFFFKKGLVNFFGNFIRFIRSLTAEANKVIKGECLLKIWVSGRLILTRGGLDDI